MPVERVPGLQKRIRARARTAGKPVVVTSQMLESMISSPVPTRAEVSDVATAVFDGADAVMLSAKSRWAVPAGGDPDGRPHRHRSGGGPELDDAILATLRPRRRSRPARGHCRRRAHAIADTVKLAAIVCYTATGSTALRVTRERPGLPIIGLTPVEATARRLSLAWGVQSVMTADPANLTDMVGRRYRSPSMRVS